MASTIVKSVRVSPEVWAMVEAHAKREGASANAVVARWLERIAEAASAPYRPALQPTKIINKQGDGIMKTGGETFKTRLKGEWKAP